MIIQNFLRSNADTPRNILFSNQHTKKCILSLLASSMQMLHLMKIWDYNFRKWTFFHFSFCTCLCLTLKIWYQCHPLYKNSIFPLFHHPTLNWVILKTLKNFMAPFYGWSSTASRLEPLQGGCLLFATKFPETGTHFIDLRRMKDWVNCGATYWFWTRDPWSGNPVPKPLISFL